MKNSVKRRIIYAVEICLASPLCVSGGLSEQTDTDVQRDFDGNPFVPGTTLAGALRDWLIKLGEDSSLFGEEGEDSRMSPLRISDMRFKGEIRTQIRDGVRLENKLAVETGKYDMEILETGITGIFRMELTVRENQLLEGQEQKEEQPPIETLWERQIGILLSALEDGNIRLGANKNRGFGRIRIKEVRRKAFDQTNVMEWLGWVPGQEELFQEWMKDQWYSPAEDLYITFRIPLRLTGGISIRRYSANPEGPNFEHITCNGVSVIPGTSWNGAIRSRAGELLCQLGYPARRIEGVLKEWFGYADDDRKKSGAKNRKRMSKTAKQSQIVISESQIDGGSDLELTRNKISRFEASTVESALYSEKAHFQGETELEIKVRKQTLDCSAICGLLLLTVKDIENGYLAVGGQTAVGRGVFAGTDEDTVPEEKKKEYFRALNELIQRGRNAAC